MSYFKRVLELVGERKGKFFLGLLCAFLKNFSFVFIFMALFIGFSNINHLTVNLVINCIGILLAGVLFHFVFAYMEYILVSAEGYTMIKFFRLDVGNRMKKAPLGYFNDKRLGNIQGALTNTITSLENYSMMLLTGIIGGFGISIILTFALFNIHLSLGLLMIPVLLVIGVLLYRLYSVAMNHVPLQHKKEQEMNFAVLDMIRGMSVLRTFPLAEKSHLRGVIQEKAKNVYEEKRVVDINCERDYSWQAKLYSFVISLSSIALIIITINLYLTKQINLANTLTMIVGSYLIFLGLAPLSDSAFLYVKVPSNQKYVDTVLDIPIIPEGKNTEIEGTADLEFKDVYFSYNQDRQIIKGISFKINEGDKVAIVGPSGSGKTTIVNLISRFWDIDSGSIKLANKDIREYSVDTLLKNLSMVFQDVYLFNDSVINNVRFAKPEASDEEIMAVCKKARCHEFIMEMKDGYNTVIGEGGANISGGEKQRISIARALLKDAPIILLDEATSSVDPENEAEILAAIAELCKGKTVISIAHRLSTVEDANQILVIDDGKLVETGNHQDLLKQKGLYAGFVNARLQAKGWRINN